MAPLLLAFGVFVVAAAVVVGVYYAFTRLPQYLIERRIQQRMADVAKHVEPEPTDAFNIVKEQAEGVLPGLRQAGDRHVVRHQHREAARSGRQQGRQHGAADSRSSSASRLSFAVTALLRAPWGLIPGFAAGAAIPFLVLHAQADASASAASKSSSRSARSPVARDQGRPCVHDGDGHGCRRRVRSDRARVQEDVR